MSAETAIRSQIDSIAAIRKAAYDGFSGMTDMWATVDAAANEAYENRVKGTTIATLRDDVRAGKMGNMFAEWFRLHRDYFQIDASLTNLDTGLASYLWRVSEFFNLVHYESEKTYLTLDHVWPREDLDLGSFTYNGSVFVTGSAVDTTLSGMGRLAVDVVGIPIGGSNLVLSITATRRDDTPATIALTVPTLSAVGTKVILGQQAHGTNSNAGQKVVTVAATGHFKAAVGERVLIWDNNGAEWAIVDTLVTNTSLTMVSNLRNSYTTAASAKVAPLLKDITACTASSGTNGDVVNFVVSPDRTIAI